MLSKFNEKTQKIIAIAESQAFDFGHASVGTEHLLLSLLRVKESKLKSLLSSKGVTYDVVKEKVIQLFGKKQIQPFYMEYTPSLKKIMERAILEAKKLSLDKVNIDVLTFCMLNEEENVAKEILISLQIDVDTLKKELKKFMKKASELDTIEDLLNLNEYALKNSDVVYEREEELNQLIDVLLRKQKPNAILIGEPGVGKTALVYELARRIATNDIVDELKDKIIYELDLSCVVAGTKYRGEFEEKLKKIIHKVKEDKRAILFIDEIHNLIGAGGAEGAIDASNILKPYLSRKDIQLIGATTYDEYLKIFEKEKALNRRFQPLMIYEPSKEKTGVILNNIKDLYSTYHAIEIKEELITKLIDYCANYVFDRCFPDKAIDVLDFACVRAKKLKKSCLEEEDVIKVIESLYHVKISKDDKGKQLIEALKNEVLGQEEAINKIGEQISCIEKGLIEESRPLGVYLFVGPTGVGKTEIAKQIAKTYFGSSDKLCKLDMAEYMGKESVNKLIGSPPGYVGYNEPSELVTFMRKNPYSVILLDEVEKAHREVLDIFLNVFDEGYFYDATKKKIDFKNSIIILTSNLGYGEEVYNKKSIGFLSSNLVNDEIDKAIAKHFRPEFLNRLDEVIKFNRLDKDVCLKLAKKYYNEYQVKLGLEAALLDDEYLSLVGDSQIEKYGARGIKRSVRKKVVELLKNKTTQKVV